MPRNPTSRSPIVPAVDIHENDEGFLLVADLPGVSEAGLAIEIDRGELRIEGEIPDRQGQKYRRVFTVPDGIDRDNVRAELKAGVLNLTLPKGPTIKARRIPVQAV